MAFATMKIMAKKSILAKCCNLIKRVNYIQRTATCKMINLVEQSGKVVQVWSKYGDGNILKHTDVELSRATVFVAYSADSISARLAHLFSLACMHLGTG